MQPIEELRYLILAAQREGNRLFAEALRPLGLTPSQAEVLRVLHDHAPLSLIALGDLLVCETGSPSRLVQGLVEDGLVERLASATDKRMVTLSLTNQGREMATKVAALESQFYEANASVLKDAPLPEFEVASVKPAPALEGPMAEAKMRAMDGMVDMMVGMVPLKGMTE